MGILIFLICLAASVIGGICGIGGGVIIKPMLDAMNLMSVSVVSFLSGLTVFSMSAISVIRRRKSRMVELRTGSLLAAGAVVGGIAGNATFHQLKGAVGQDRFVGLVQSVVLAVITLLTLLYSVYFRKRLPSYHVSGAPACMLIGALMGIMSSFLSIGGGPINLAILFFAFSMDTKKAAANSLYIIMFSQGASFLTSCLRRTIPDFSWTYLLSMVAAGVLGGFLAERIDRHISWKTTDRLFSGLLGVIFLICLYNIGRFAT